MDFAVTGATGFIGNHLVAHLERGGHGVVTLGRRKAGQQRAVGWDPVGGLPPASVLEGTQAVIHLAGEPVAQRWTDSAKRRMRDSRVVGTTNLVAGLARLDRRPEVLVCASAIGYYGSRGDEILTEDAAPGTGFLPEMCLAWEGAARGAEALGVRVIRLRIGIVLGRGGGALAKMLPPFRAGIGGPLGSGRQWMPWIHVRDLVRMIEFAVTQPACAGAVNAVGPNPVTNREFVRALGRVLRRPAVFPVPEFGLRLLYGEMAEVVLGSQRVVPAVAVSRGFTFEFNELETALQSLQP